MNGKKLLTLLAILAPCLAKPDDLVNRNAMITAGVPIHELFGRDLELERRQLQCQQATDTPCADGTGCCPRGNACIYVTRNGNRYPACDEPCPDAANPCGPAGLCCDFNEYCGAGGLCATKTSGFVTPPPVVSVTSPSVVSGGSSTFSLSSFSESTPSPTKSTHFDSSSGSFASPTTTSRRHNESGTSAQSSRSVEIGSIAGSSSSSTPSATQTGGVTRNERNNWIAVGLSFVFGGLL